MVIAMLGFRGRALDPLQTAHDPGTRSFQLDGTFGLLGWMRSGHGGATVSGRRQGHVGNFRAGSTSRDRPRWVPALGPELSDSSGLDPDLRRRRSASIGNDAKPSFPEWKRRTEIIGRLSTCGPG